MVSFGILFPVKEHSYRVSEYKIHVDTIEYNSQLN